MKQKSFDNKTSRRGKNASAIQKLSSTTTKKINKKKKSQPIYVRVSKLTLAMCFISYDILACGLLWRCYMECCSLYTSSFSLQQKKKKTHSFFTVPVESFKDKRNKCIQSLQFRNVCFSFYNNNNNKKGIKKTSNQTHTRKTAPSAIHVKHVQHKFYFRKHNSIKTYIKR